MSQCIEMYNYNSTIMSYILGQALFSFIVCGGRIASFPGSPPLRVLTLDLCTHLQEKFAANFWLRVSSKVKRALEADLEGLGTRLGEGGTVVF